MSEDELADLLGRGDTRALAVYIRRVLRFLGQLDLWHEADCSESMTGACDCPANPVDRRIRDLLGDPPPPVEVTRHGH